jgi:putative tryptophan/tyrosine transport system substrate-binding protein
MRRRHFITLIGTAMIAGPLRARAQRAEQMRLVGVLMSTAEGDAEGKARILALRDQLHMLGWTEDRNIRFDYRWGAGNPELTRRFAHELVALKPDVIVSQNTAAVPPLLEATHSIPIIFTQVTEPVAAGFVASMARPGGNITGFTSFEPTMGGKWLEMLKEFVPRITRAALVFDPDASPLRGAGFLRSATEAASSSAVTIISAPFREPDAIERTLTEFAREPNGGLIVLPDASTNANRSIILQVAAKFRLPAVYAFPFFVRSGGLISYGPDPIDQFQRAAAYVDRILKGAEPADLPVQAPTKFELVINLKTAKVLSIDVPLHLQQLADEVIE